METPNIYPGTTESPRENPSPTRLQASGQKKRIVTFSILAVLLLVIVGLMAWQAYSNAKTGQNLDSGWWIGSASTLVLGLLALFLGFQAAGPSWSDSVSQSLEKLVSFTEGLSSGVERVDSAGQRVQNVIKIDRPVTISTDSSAAEK